jgi:acetyl/propionyl-CoA carboxylase alpha subunit
MVKINILNDESADARVIERELSKAFADCDFLPTQGDVIRYDKRTYTAVHVVHHVRNTESIDNVYVTIHIIPL